MCISSVVKRYKLNVWDVGGQKSLRSYWRNYFETTDGLIWVVDSADKRRLEDCFKELHTLVDEEVTFSNYLFKSMFIIVLNIILNMLDVYFSTLLIII